MLYLELTIRACLRVLKNKSFSKWATKERISDNALQTAVDQMERGLVDADLGGHVFCGDCRQREKWRCPHAARLQGR
ncbi:type II toxin-antitoxin system RelE/ParE family toxin [uncultured Paraglaciecola sp.]|uniref:type II toxin-antitoxin system RelE/ParE family toxin n=1 Tax=uncultured Paraglaciecola sp. TaxID=1765024 RepID=UPI00260CC5A1|nr:type II toxin-antitoxin system RelE/ParE family toxin [uncultured Paraglaciecola sp.]